MLCKWCGMESATADQCSWCHRSFASTTTEGSGAVSAEQPTPLGALPRSEWAAPNTLGGEEVVEDGIGKAPWNVAPPAVAPAPVAKIEDAGDSRPIIGVRRPVSGRMPMPAPPMSKPGSAAPTRPGGTPPRPPAPVIPMGTKRPGGGGSPPAHVPAPPVPTQGHSPIAGVRPPSASPANQVTPLPTTAAPSRPAPHVGLAGGTAVAPGTRPTVSAPVTQTSPTTPTRIMAPEPPPPPRPEVNVPTLGTFTATKSKYYAGQVIDPISGTHYDSETGIATASANMPAEPRATTASKSKKMQVEWLDIQVSQSTLVMRYLLAFLGILGFAGFCAWVFDTVYVVPLLMANFVGALLLPIMKVAPWADEDTEDVLWFVLLTLVFGPFISLIIYGIVSALRQSANPAVVGCFGVAALARLVTELTSGGVVLAHLAPWVGHFDLKVNLVNWAGLVALLGWYTATMFHKLDE